MSQLPEKAQAQLRKIVARLESDHPGEREAAVTAARKLLDR